MAIVREQDDGTVEIVLGAEEAFWFHRFLDGCAFQKGTVEQEVRDELLEIIQGWIVSAS